MIEKKKKAVKEKTRKGVLIAVGGGESSTITDDSVKIIETFLEYAGGAKKAKIVVMTVATDNPENAGERYQELFDRVEFKNFETLNIADRSESFDEAILEKVAQASGLYFTGGAQLHVTALTGGTPLHALISERFNEGLTIGGTSAGAMMMSSSTLVRGSADRAPKLGSVEVAPGMNLLENTIIDTHFSQRGRHGRLLSAVAHNPQTLGIGIDERTAIVVENTKFRVVGEGAATVIDVGNSQHTNLPYIKTDQTIGIFGVNFHVLPDGYEFDLREREPVSPDIDRLIKRK